MTTIVVSGVPAPKGSNRAIARRGRAFLVAGSSDVGKHKLEAWSWAVRAAAMRACRSMLRDKPVAVSITFHMPRPSAHSTSKGLKASAPLRPNVKPDLDKLARATLDPLSGVAYDDDSRIVELVVRKVYAAAGRTGALITVQEWQP